jgi:hypothetical protein
MKAERLEDSFRALGRVERVCAAVRARLGRAGAVS